MTSNKQYTYVQKVWLAAGIFALIIVLLLLLKATFNVFLLVLAGVLIAVFFRGLSGLIQRKTRLREGSSVAIAIISTIVMFGLLIWLMGAKIQSQAEQLSKALPTTIENAKSKLRESSLGKNILERLSSPEAQKKSQAFIQTFFKSSFGMLGDIYVVLFVGIFFTVAPNTYKKGIVKLIPPNGKEKGQQVLDQLANDLMKWLKGKLFAMLVVSILTAIGLLIIGVPMWLVLSLIAGILNFIPNFGPLIALIPAVLVALVQSPTAALWVTALYISVQVVESNFITPVVQQKLISIPPALIIIAQLLMAALTGGWGLILATPLMVIILVLIKELYIKRQGISS